MDRSVADNMPDFLVMYF